MKIFVDGQWYTLPYKLLIISLTAIDKANIADMPKDHDLYCEFDPDIFNVPQVKKLLKKLKKEAQNENAL